MMVIDSETKMYNSNMCLYFLNEYIERGKIPQNLVDVNIASDYSKLSNMLELCKNESKIDILEKSILGEGVVAEIISKFNPANDFAENEFVSMLFYLGFLTIIDNKGVFAKIGIPNKVMKELYSEYFLKVIATSSEFENPVNYAKI